MYNTIIQKALEEGLFRLYYQAKINLHTKRVESAEALIRIEDSTGLIKPLMFVPAAEKSDDIIALDRWVFNRLIADSRHISMMSREDITISFNASSKHFNQASFLESLESTFDFTVDFLSQFEIELKEDALINDVEDTRLKLEKLKEKGFKIAIDDFGTGYSSLLHLKDFPIDTIKIDKAFIDGIESDEKTKKIIESIIYLAKKLDLKIVAEGVESVHQVQWLYDHGCDEIQGYYYSQPLEMNKFIKFVKAVNHTENSNAYIKWSHKYSINNYALDTHHMIIANILNKLYEELQDAKMIDKTDVQEYFSLLERYITIHFETEEQYMRDIDAPDIDSHIAAHGEFKKLLDQFRENLSLSNQKNSYELFIILKKWFVNHELTMDMEQMNVK